MKENSSKVKQSGHHDQHFDTLNKKIDDNTSHLESLERQVSLMMTKIMGIEDCIHKFLSNSGYANQKSPILDESEEDEHDDKETKDFDIQEELTKTKSNIEKMSQDISERIDYVTKTFIYENLKDMDCFPKIVRNEKEYDELNTQKQSLSKKCDIFAEDKEKNKYYIDIISSDDSESELKIDDTKKHSILAKVINVLKTPEINYFIYILKAKDMFKSIIMKKKNLFKQLKI